MLLSIICFNLEKAPNNLLDCCCLDQFHVHPYRRIAPGFLRHLPSTHVPRVVHLLTRSRPPRDGNLFQFKTHMFYRGFSLFNHNYRKPPTITSPGLIHFRKRFLMGLYEGGGGGVAYLREG